MFLRTQEGSYLEQIPKEELGNSVYFLGMPDPEQKFLGMPISVFKNDKLS